MFWKPKTAEPSNSNNEKIFTLLFSLAAIAAFADVTPTNAVKISSLPAGTIPLAGGEYVPIIQAASGVGIGTSNQTKIVTVNSLLNPATTAANAAQLSANNASNAIASTGANFTNELGALSQFTNSTATSLAAHSAALAALGALSKSNSIVVAQVTDAGSMARESTNTWYRAANPSGYQTAGQVSASITSALAGVGGGNVASNSAVTFSSVNTPTVDNGGFQASNGNTKNIYVNLAAASFQKIELNSGGTSATFNFIATNAVDGGNVYLLAVATNGVGFKVTQSGGANWNMFWNGTVSSATTNACLLNWQTIGGMTIYTGAPSP